MTRVDDMMRLGGEIRVMIHNPKIDGSAIAKKLAELTDQVRDAVGIKGDIDVTFDPDRARYVMTLKRPSPLPIGRNLCASRYLFDRFEDMKQIPPIHLEVTYTLNNLDGILTREERLHGGKRIL
jgi:hypothetical protein